VTIHTANSRFKISSGPKPKNSHPCSRPDSPLQLENSSTINHSAPVIPRPTSPKQGDQSHLGRSRRHQSNALFTARTELSDEQYPGLLSFSLHMNSRTHNDELAYAARGLNHHLRCTRRLSEPADVATSSCCLHAGLVTISTNSSPNGASSGGTWACWRPKAGWASVHLSINDAGQMEPRRIPVYLALTFSPCFRVLLAGPRHLDQASNVAHCFQSGHRALK
jgi:hypothetical protein